MRTVGKNRPACDTKRKIFYTVTNELVNVIQLCEIWRATATKANVCVKFEISATRRPETIAC